ASRRRRRDRTPIVAPHRDPNRRRARRRRCIPLPPALGEGTQRLCVHPRLPKSSSARPALMPRVILPNACGIRGCEGGDSNPHGLLHWILSPARLPVPPPSRLRQNLTVSKSPCH